MIMYPLVYRISVGSASLIALQPLAVEGMVEAGGA